jgi:hypothetical protein
VDNDAGLVAMEDVKEAVLQVAGGEEKLALGKRHGSLALAHPRTVGSFGVRTVDAARCGRALCNGCSEWVDDVVKVGPARGAVWERCWWGKGGWLLVVGVAGVGEEDDVVRREVVDRPIVEGHVLVGWGHLDPPQLMTGGHEHPTVDALGAERRK